MAKMVPDIEEYRELLAFVANKPNDYIDSKKKIGATGLMPLGPTVFTSGKHTYRDAASAAANDKLDD